jgi:hypothetical protein
MTALSYSLKHINIAVDTFFKCKIITCTTFTTKSRENGNVTNIKRIEKMTIR